MNINYQKIVFLIELHDQQPTKLQECYSLTCPICRKIQKVSNADRKKYLKQIMKYRIKVINNWDIITQNKKDLYANADAIGVPPQIIKTYKKEWR